VTPPLKLLVLALLAAAAATGGAGWKWHQPPDRSGGSGVPIRIAGWSWDDGSVTTA
jgi:ABC-type proline/glycine betaine transport system substrate-binding protein